MSNTLVLYEILSFDTWIIIFFLVILQYARHISKVKRDRFWKISRLDGNREIPEILLRNNCRVINKLVLKYSSPVELRCLLRKINVGKQIQIQVSKSHVNQIPNQIIRKTKLDILLQSGDANIGISNSRSRKHGLITVGNMTRYIKCQVKAIVSKIC